MDVNTKILQSKIILLISCFILIFVAACNDSKIEKIPSNIIGKDTMVLMLAEMHLLESSLGIRIFEDKKLMNTRNSVKTKIYKDFGISKEQFYKSYEYYSLKPMLIDSMYINVISEITERQAKLNKK